MVTLYRAYRPQTFAEIVGQNHIKITLQNELKQGKIAHAYLFTGPRGIGKTTTARLIAKAVNCEKRKAGESEPCDECPSCVDIRELRSLDVAEIDAASNTGVDNVRESIINNARFTPSKSKYKVFIIDEVHMLSNSAFNALLKTLEEPPAHAIFILATTEIHKIPTTIISRCQRFDFRKVNYVDMVDHLNKVAHGEKIKIESGIVEDIARYSDGYLRDGLSLLGQILSLDEKEISREQAELIMPRSNFLAIEEFVSNLINKNESAALSLLAKLVDEGVDLTQFNRELVDFLRKVMLAKVNKKLDPFTLDISSESDKKITEIIERATINWLVAAMSYFISAGLELKNAFIVQLPLELAVVKLCHEGENSGSCNSESRPVVDNPAPSGIKKFIQSTASSVKSVLSEEKKPEPAMAEKFSADDDKTIFNLVCDNWSQIVSSIDEANPSLVLILKVGQPLKVLCGTLEIGFRFPFHVERANDHKNRTMIEEKVASVIGRKAKIKAVVSSEIELAVFEPKAEKDGAVAAEVDASIAEVLNVLGGKVVG